MHKLDNEKYLDEVSDGFSFFQKNTKPYKNDIKVLVLFVGFYTLLKKNGYEFLDDSQPNKKILEEGLKRAQISELLIIDWHKIVKYYIRMTMKSNTLRNEHEKFCEFIVDAFDKINNIKKGYFEIFGKSKK